jgi:hypothetical protein
VRYREGWIPAVPGKCQIREMGDLPEKFRTAFRFAEI